MNRDVKFRGKQKTWIVGGIRKSQATELVENITSMMKEE